MRRTKTSAVPSTTIKSNGRTANAPTAKPMLQGNTVVRKGFFEVDQPLKKMPIRKVK